MDADQFRDAAHLAVESVIQYFNSLRSLDVVPDVKPGYLLPRLPAEAPKAPEPVTSVFSDIENHIMPGLVHWQHPSFMAWFPASVSYPSILGEIFSAAFTSPGFNWICSPASTELEIVILDWMAKVLGLDNEFISSSGMGGGGVIQGSASEAIVTVMVAARERAVRSRLEAIGLWPPQDSDTEQVKLRRENAAMDVRSRLVALGSSQSHSSTQKAAMILGVRYRSVCATLRDGCSMSGKALREALKECKSAGLVPCYLTATLGTTSTGAIDNFAEIAEVKQDWPDLWVHVDAAFAGSALCCPEVRSDAGAQHLRHFESFNMNMHKWMLVNFDASLLYVRDPSMLTVALGINPSYVANPADIAGLVTDFRDWQISFGRRFRSLKIWFVLRCYGITAIQSLIRDHIKLGKLFAGLIQSKEGVAAGLKIVTGPSFGLTVFKCLPHPEQRGELSNGVADEQASGQKRTDSSANGSHRLADSLVSKEAEQALSNTFTKQVYDAVNERRDILITSTVVDGQFLIRVVSANERANEFDVRRAYEIIRDTAISLRQNSQDHSN